MKQPKKLTRNQKIILTKNGMDANSYMLLEDSNDRFTVVMKPEYDVRRTIKYTGERSGILLT